MYSSLIDAPVNTDLVLLQITRPALEKWLHRLGLFKGGSVMRHDQEVNFHPVRIKGSKGDMVIPAGMAVKIYIHLSSGEKIPLTEMEKNQEGHVELHAGGKFLEKNMARLGLNEGDNIKFLRALPHMDYVTLINRKERTRLWEGEAARIWGHYPGEAETQFYFAKKERDFTVKDIMGGPRAVRHLKTHGVEPGMMLTLETIEQANTLHHPPKAQISISSPEGLRLYLTPEQAGAIIVRSK